MGAAAIPKVGSETAALAIVVWAFTCFYYNSSTSKMTCEHNGITVFQSWSA